MGSMPLQSERKPALLMNSTHPVTNDLAGRQMMDDRIDRSSSQTRPMIARPLASFLPLPPLPLSLSIAATQAGSM